MQLSNTSIAMTIQLREKDRKKLGKANRVFVNLYPNSDDRLITLDPAAEGAIGSYKISNSNSKTYPFRIQIKRNREGIPFFRAEPVSYRIMSMGTFEISSPGSLLVANPRDRKEDKGAKYSQFKKEKAAAKEISLQRAVWAINYHKRQAGEEMGIFINEDGHLSIEIIYD